MTDPYVSFLIWKGIALLSVVGLVAFWEGYTGKKLFNRDDGAPPQHPPKDMGKVDEVRDTRLPNDRA